MKDNDRRLRILNSKLISILNRNGLRSRANKLRKENRRFNHIAIYVSKKTIQMKSKELKRLRNNNKE